MHSRRGSDPAREWVWLCARYPTLEKRCLRQARNAGKRRNPIAFGCWRQVPANRIRSCMAPGGKPCNDVPWGHHSSRWVRLRMTLGRSRAAVGTRRFHTTQTLFTAGGGSERKSVALQRRDWLSMCGNAQCPRDRKVTAGTGRKPGNSHSDPLTRKSKGHRPMTTRTRLSSNQYDGDHGHFGHPSLLIYYLA